MNLPTGTVTFLFTDIEGSTKLWEAHPEPMRLALAQHDDLLRACIESHGGQVFKTVGDAFCAVFADPRGAVKSILASQQRLLAIALATEDGFLPIKVRMALHTGVVEERDGDYFGQPLNRVARLLATGHGGQVLLSQTTFDLVRDSMPSGASVKPLGEHRLKDLGRPESVFQLLHPNLAADFPPLRSLDNPEMKHNLPQQVTSFVGREAQIAEVKGLLTRTRLLTLIGSGGSGKTRLALQVAADMLDGNVDGVWLVELASLTDPTLVASTPATVLGLKEEPGKPIQQSVTEHLKTMHLLLILDNCEHLLDACAKLADALLRNCPGVLILATSREGLGISGEQTYRVPSLSLPDPGQAQTAETLMHYEAVRLFVDRALLVQPAFSVANQNAPTLASICHRLDGIPLAIELAAARVRSLTVEDINAKLDQRFRLLTGGSRTALPRHHTLRSLIDWSYDLLTEVEQVMLCRLSVFADGWTLEAAENVCAGQVIQESNVLDLLTALTDKSLVNVTPLGTSVRYGMLESVRQYAAELLAKAGQDNLLSARHLDYFVALGEAAESHRSGPKLTEWLDRFQVEHDNLRAALSACCDPSRHVLAAELKAQRRKGLRLCSLLYRFWDQRGYFSEGVAFCRSALALTTGRRLTRSERLERAKVLGVAGALAGRQMGDSRAFMEESLGIYRDLDEKEGVARSLNSLGKFAVTARDFELARILLAESLAIARALRDPDLISGALSSLGILAFEEGDLVLARDYTEEALAHCRDRNDPRMVAFTVNHLGNIAFGEGALDEAARLHEESLAIRRELRDPWAIGISLTQLGAVRLAQGHVGNAVALQREALPILHDMAAQWGVIVCIEAFAHIAAQSSPERTARLWGAADREREDFGMPRSGAEEACCALDLRIAGSALTDQEFAVAWTAGRAMTMEQAIEFALQESNN